MLLGYARVSTNEQDLNIQIYELLKLGCDKVFLEKQSVINERPEFDNLLQQIQVGDTLVVYSLEKLGLKLNQLAPLFNNIKSRGINFKSIREVVFDTNTQMGESIFQIVYILKELEESIQSERTIVGLEKARRRGKIGGRKFGSYDKGKASAALLLYQKGDSIKDILTKLHMSRATFYRNIKKEGAVYKNCKKRYSKS